MKLAILLVVVALGAVGCRQEDIPVNLFFGNQENLLWSSTARVVVFPLSANPTTCGPLRDRVQGNDTAASIWDSGIRPVCDFNAGAVALDSVPDGKLHYVALAYDRDDAMTMLMSGCLTVDVNELDPATGVRITLMQNSLYNPYVGMRPACNDVPDKCITGTNCFPP